MKISFHILNVIEYAYMSFQVFVCYPFIGLANDCVMFYLVLSSDFTVF